MSLLDSKTHALCALALLSPACAFETATSTDGAALDETSAELYVSSPDIWGTLSIPVCWESPTAATATARGWVRDEVQRIWQTASRVRFTGWSACTNGTSAGIHIRIADETANTKVLGSALDGMASGMTLNLTMQNAANGYAQCRQAYGLEACVRSTALHEFGHALGFAHEQLRFDNTDCWELFAGDAGDVLVGAYDSLSVMNTCRLLDGPVTSLTTTDKLGLQAFYGNPSAASARKDALRWDDDTVYFFFGKRYVMYSLSLDRMMNELPLGPAYPSPIKNEWHGWPTTSPWTSGVDAAVDYSSTKVLFFSGNQYVRYDRASDQVDANYPRTLPAGWSNWPATWTSVDAALRWPRNNRVYLFRGSEYLRITNMSVDAGYPKPIAGNWSVPFTTGFDYAITSPTSGKAYFFKGTEYARVDVDSDTLDGTFSMAGRWPGVTY